VTKGDPTVNPKLWYYQGKFVSTSYQLRQSTVGRIFLFRITGIGWRSTNQNQALQFLITDFISNKKESRQQFIVTQTYNLAEVVLPVQYLPPIWGVKSVN
jgi:hypothetical protein